MLCLQQSEEHIHLLTEPGTLRQLGQGDTERGGQGLILQQMSWLGEKVLENVLWVGEWGAWAPFRTAQLPSRREMRVACRGSPETPACTPGSRGLRLGLGAARHIRPGLGSRVVSAESPRKPSPWGGKRRCYFSWGRNRTLPARDNASKSPNNSTPVD